MSPTTTTQPSPFLRRLRRILLSGLLVLLVPVCGLVIYFLIVTRQSLPPAASVSVSLPEVSTPVPGLRKCGQGWFRQSKSGLWELYVEGDGYTRGVVSGRLTRELAQYQETVFINQIKELVPSERYLKVLGYFIAYFNRNMPAAIPEEYLNEIYGLSLSASDKYDVFATKYYRLLNYHSAHDIGHALQDKHMTVGCTSFGVWNSRTADGKLLIGRNFDFFAGEDFARNKVVCFTRPDKGHAFMYVTWPGFVGAVSGMNDRGLAVTLNAAKSQIPSQAATPISLLAKEILQYAGNISEAYAIAETRQSFVSESILIGSAADHRVAIIEKTPGCTNLYAEQGEQLICSNHFKSPLFANDYLNNKNKVESSSLYREYRMQQLLSRVPHFTEAEVAKVLRDQKGINDLELGLTNEKSINQLIAHHSVIFKPEERRVWVSTAPYQLGQYVCYDLNKVFSTGASLNENKEIIDSSLSIAADPFLSTSRYKDLLLYKQIKRYLQLCMQCRPVLQADARYLRAFVRANPENYVTYWVLGDYYKCLGERSLALQQYTMALSKEVATLKEREQLQALKSKLEQESVNAD